MTGGDDWRGDWVSGDRSVTNGSPPETSLNQVNGPTDVDGDPALLGDRPQRAGCVRDQLERRDRLEGELVAVLEPRDLEQVVHERARAAQVVTRQLQRLL